MESLLVRIRETVHDLTGKDRQIAEFVLQHESEIPRLTISQVAQACNSSQAAVVRCCKLFGCQGYKDFRSSITKDILERAHQTDILKFRYITELTEDEGIPSIVERIAIGNMRSIQETEALLDYEVLEQAVDALVNTKRICFFGVGASGIVAMDAYQKFIRIGKICNANSDSHVQMTLASSLQASDVAVVISYSGRTKDVLELAIAAQERGAMVIAITKYSSDNPLADMADIVLYTTATESAHRSSATSSRIAQLTVVDILFAGTASRNMEVYSGNLENTYRHAVAKKT